MNSPSVRRASGGFLFLINMEQLHRQFLKSSGIAHDTRNQELKNKLFFCLKGENFNGNEFAEKALQQGARLVIVDEEEFHRPGQGTIMVKDSLETLQNLAGFHRASLKIPILALTGSNGKTTTKELINSVLSQQFTTTATRGNLNNHIGVPITLLNMDEKTEIGIVEMGANHPGEIKFLCAIADPDYGLITNFAKAHLEGFKNLEGVIRTKTELYQYLKNKNGLVFVNGEDPVQMKYSKEIRRFTFGNKNTDCPVQLLDSPENLNIFWNHNTIQTQITGSYNFGNISAAIAVGMYFKMEPEKIIKGIGNYLPSSNRSQILRKNSNRILLDAYNANPGSMMAALENFSNLEGEKILILGDMLELGKEAAREHRQILNYIDSRSFEKVFLVGSHFYNTPTENPVVKKFKTFEELKTELRQTRFKNKNILIKASRSMALERVPEFILEN